MRSDSFQMVLDDTVYVAAESRWEIINNSENVRRLLLLLLLTIISKAQILKKPSALYKEHDGSGGVG